MQSPITPAAYLYELIEVHLTSDNKDHSVETTKTWIRKAMVAQGISPLDCLLFEAGLVKDVKVADALASWRQMEAASALLPRFCQVNGHMGTAAFGGGTVNSDVHDSGETIARLDTLVAIVAARLIGNKEMLLHDVNGASVCVELEYFRMVDYALGNTGNVHYDATTPDHTGGRPRGVGREASATATAAAGPETGRDAPPKTRRDAREFCG